MSSVSSASTGTAPNDSSQYPAGRQPQHNFPKRSSYRLYLLPHLSTWNARTSSSALLSSLPPSFPERCFRILLCAVRSAVAAILGSWIGGLVDSKNRLHIVRQSIVWQRISVALSCLVLAALLAGNPQNGLVLYGLFAAIVALAGVEKLAFAANTVAVERDWIIVVSDSLGVERQELNSAMRRIDLICKLIAPLGIGLLDGYSTKIAIWVVFGQNAISVLVEYFAIAQVYSAIPSLDKGKSKTPLKHHAHPVAHRPPRHDPSSTLSKTTSARGKTTSKPAFWLPFPYRYILTVLSFASQMTTYLLTLGFTSTHVSIMRLVAVILELSATCAAPLLMSESGAVRSGLWFINEQLFSHHSRNQLFRGYHVINESQTRRSRTCRWCLLVAPGTVGVRSLRAVLGARRRA